MALPSAHVGTGRRPRARGGREPEPEAHSTQRVRGRCVGALFSGLGACARCEHTARGRASSPSRRSAGLPPSRPQAAFSRRETRLLVVVLSSRDTGAHAGGCSATRAAARCACRSKRIELPASTSATPATAAKQGCGPAAHEAGVAGDAVGCPSGDEQVHWLDPGAPRYPRVAHPSSECRFRLGAAARARVPRWRRCST